MRRGTRVGQAYVAITADGSGINEEIVDSLDDVKYEKIGHDAQGSFLKGWNNGMRQELSGRISDALGDLRRDAAKAGESFTNDMNISQGVRRELRNMFTGGDLEPLMRSLGERIGTQFGDSLDNALRASVLDSLEEALEDAARKGKSLHLTVNATGEMPMMPSGFLERIEEQARKAVEIERRAEAQRVDAKRESQSQIDRILEMGARNRQKWAEQTAEIEDRLTSERIKEDNDLLATQQRILDKAQREWQDLGRIQAQAMRMNEKFNAGKLDGRGYAVSGNGKDDRSLVSDATKMIDRVSTLFGRGSRNNFLNLLGSTIGNLSKGLLTLGTTAFKVGETLVDTGRKAVGFFQTFATNAAQHGLSTAMGMAANSITFTGTTAATAGLNLAVLAGVMAAVTAAAVLLTSVMAALLTVVAALASTVVSGLTAALAVGAAAFVPVIAGAGLLTAAFMSMTDAQKDLLKDAFRPLRAEMVGIGQLMIGPMSGYFQTWSTNLQNALLQLAPIARVMGEAFGQAGAIITKSLSGTGFNLLADQLEQRLPRITINLSRAFGDFLNGMAGIFAALMPTVQRFSRYLADVANRFSEWATSTEGQNEISDFIDRAVESLKSLWGVLRETGGLLADVLFNKDVQNTGNDMFDGLASGIRDVRKWFAEAAKDGRLKGWLESAKEFAYAFADAIRAAAGVVRRFVNSGTLDTLSGLLRTAARFFDRVSGAIDGLKDAARPFASMMSSVINALGGIGNAATIAAGPLYNLLDLIGRVNGAKISGKSMGKSTDPVIRPRPTIGPALQRTAPSTSSDSFSRSSFSRQGRDTVDSLVKSGEEALAATSKGGGGGGGGRSGGAPKRSSRGGKGGGNGELRRIMADIREGLEQIAAASSLDDARENLKSLSQMINGEGKRFSKIAKYVQKQAKVNWDRVHDLEAGVRRSNATLADYALARERVAARLEAAQRRLEEAIETRDSFRRSVTDAAKAFGALTTAEAQTLDGVEQSLTAGDITDNLATRLAKIKEFQSDLQLLLAQGLSNAAYQQIVEAGVENGQAFADALLAGGVGAIQETNGLVSQIGAISDQLGLETSTRLYQAGVDAARGLVAGLTSLSAELDSAATALGNSIAKAIKKSLGIKSPSTVLRDMMDHVGDGAVIGLDNQHDKVGAAAGRLADTIAVSPQAAQSAGTTRAEGVSGNGQKFRDLVINTPTEDPHAVAMEVLDEVTGRL